MRGALLLASWLWLVPAPAGAQPALQEEPSPGASPAGNFAFFFAPLLGSFEANDSRISDHGFEPVATPFLPTFGLRARLQLESGLILGGAMSYGILVRDEELENPVPTTINLMSLGSILGYRLPPPLHGLSLETDLGFAAMTQTLGSARQAGALVYLGPMLHPRVGYTILEATPFLHLSLGYYLHVPVGPAHENPLWEEDFSLPVIHAATLGVELGVGL